MNPTDDEGLPDTDWEMTQRLRAQARHPSTPDPLAQLELAEIKPMSPLTVHVEFLELLDHCNGDEGLAFEILGRLKDFLR